MALNTERLQRPTPPASEGVVSNGVTAGLANTVTDQASQLAMQIGAAKKFSDDAGVALARQAHSVTSGQALLSSFVCELNRLAGGNEAVIYAAPNWSELEAVIADAKKPLAPCPTLQITGKS